MVCFFFFSWVPDGDTGMYGFREVLNLRLLLLSSSCIAIYSRRSQGSLVSCGPVMVLPWASVVVECGRRGGNDGCCVNRHSEGKMAVQLDTYVNIYLTLDALAAVCMSVRPAFRPGY